MSKQILNLQNALFEASGNEQDCRFKNWCKFIDSVDTSKQNGYALVGDFVRDGTVEIEIKPRLFLVASVSGSMKYHNTTYRVVKMLTDGTFEPTDIVTTDKTPGWALRIRDKVATLLVEISTETDQIPHAENPLAQFSDEEIRAEFVRRGLTL